MANYLKNKYYNGDINNNIDKFIWSISDSKNYLNNYTISELVSNDRYFRFSFSNYYYLKNNSKFPIFIFQLKK